MNTLIEPISVLSQYDKGRAQQFPTPEDPFHKQYEKIIKDLVGDKTRREGLSQLARILRHLPVGETSEL